MAVEGAEDTGAKRIDALRVAAGAGNAGAQLELANRLHFGDGVGRDAKEAYRWMRKAADAGIAEAQSKLGCFLTMGWGVAPDPRGALKWFVRGLRGGYAKAGYNLGEAYRKGRHTTYSPRRAWFFFSKAVELGDEASNWGLARLCHMGVGVPKDVEKARVLMRRAVRADFGPAIVEMGRLCREGIADPEDFAEAEARALALHRPGDLASLHVLFELRREAHPAPPPPPGLQEVVAELDRRYAARRAVAQPLAEQFRAGVDMFWGRGVEKDVPGALALLEPAAAAGNADAARFLALSYDEGGGAVPKSPETATRWYEEAARLGDAHASFVVGTRLYEGETPEGRARGLELIERAAALGFPHACGYLGRLEARAAGTRADLLEARAFPLLRLGAVRGDDEAAWLLAWGLGLGGGSESEAAYWHNFAAHREARSAYGLGLAYGNGAGVERSDERAAAWMALAAEMGEARAGAQLAAAFFDGRGVPGDLLLAARLARRAAEGGAGLGAKVLGDMYAGGIGVPCDEALAAAWYRRGAEMGHRASMASLATALFDGRGVGPDPAAAVPWLRKAADRDPDAQALLSVMLYRGEGVARDPAEARRLFLRASADGHVPSLFTTIEEEALRFRPAGTRPRRMKERIAQAADEIELLSPRAALDAGILAWNRDLGLPADDALAARFFRAAAEKGDALAAACLSHALFTAGDLEGELEWLEKAARAGLPGAQRHLALRLVETGRAAWDDPRVVALYESAADAGDAIACVELARHLERTGAAVEARGAERVAALRRCAEASGFPEEPTAVA